MKRRILIVDDTPEFVDLIKMRLEANGYDVIVAHDGDEGVTRAVHDIPDLILLDVMMPGRDGFGVLTKLKLNPDTKRIPVIMLTAKGESRSMLKAMDLRAADYLIKPCLPHDLLGTIERHIAGVVPPSLGPIDALS